MATNSPVLHIMIEVVTNDSVGLPAVQLAGEIIAADAAFNMRMADAHGRTGHGTAAGMTDHIAAYEDEIQNAQKAWSTFKDDVTRAAAMSAEPQEALERALRDVRRKLDALK